MIIRELYLQKLRPYIDKPVIKVITGMRRVGKSYLARQIIRELKSKGIEDHQVLYINKELLDFDEIQDYQDLNKFVKEYYSDFKYSRYLIIDEIQEIKDWEKAITSYFAEGNYDIYVTGSNSKLLSSELSTYIAGRYVEINIYSLGFNEFLEFRKKKNLIINDEFQLYLKYGGFPVIHHFDLNEEVCYQYISSLYNTILIKDIIGKYQVRNVRLFQDIVKFVFNNIGQIFSSNSINKFLKSQNKNVGVDTIQNYLSHLESSMMIHKVQRYDIKGKKVLELYEKYYLGDLSLKNAIFGYREQDIAGMLENLVFLKLKRDNYKIYIGKIDDYEIDFIAEKSNEKKYIQVSYLLQIEKTMIRESRGLEKIKDNYPKYIISMDQLPPTNTNGIIRIHLIDFLLDNY